MESQDFYDDLDRYGERATAKSLEFWVNAAPVIELLARDESFFVAAQQLTVSVHNHWFCLECALSKEGHKPHPNHDPSPWEYISRLPHMEAAIVQATRAVEAILGKPAKRDSKGKSPRTIQRWEQLISIDPNSSFLIANKSYIDFYYELFDIRNSAAHTFGTIPIAFKRELAIKSQCFAWEVLSSYYQQRAFSRELALETLKFNKTLLKDLRLNPS